MIVLDPTWLGWMIGFVTLAWVSPATVRPLALAGTTLVFISVRDPLSALILAAMALLTVVVGRNRHAGPGVIAALVVSLLGVLVVLKLAANQSATAAMPLGASYYTFRCVHYLLERLKRRLPPHSFAEFVSYIFFLPTLIAGPIHRFEAFHQDLRRPRDRRALVSAGLERILYGYAKIIVLSNFVIEQQLRPLADSITEATPRLAAYCEMLLGGFSGYLLFAGYSDIAIGAAMLVGFKVIENFDHPFAARNIIEFWQRWHISLTTWVREYLYTSLFSLTRRPYFAAVLTMVGIGLWHEISWRYLAWGFVHGIAIVVCQRYRRFRTVPDNACTTSHSLRVAGAWFLTFHFVMLSFVFVQHDFSGAIALYRQMILGG